MLALLLLVELAACGFRMRGVTPLPFDSIYIGIADNTLFGAEIRRGIRAISPDTVQTSRAEDAQVRLQELALTRDRREVSLDPQGQVEEYELSLTFSYRLIDRDGRVLIPDTALTASRDLPYDSQIVQAKQGEMEMLYESMQRGLVDRIIRRLSSPDVRDAFQRAEAAHAEGLAGDLPLLAPDAPPEAAQDDRRPPGWLSDPSEFDSPGRRDF